MIYVILFILVLINLFFAQSFRQGKFISFVLMLFMWVLFWANTNNPDRENYLSMYNGIQMDALLVNSNIESGYLLLMKIGTSFGFSYEFFLAIVVMFSFFLIHSTVKEFSNNYNYIYLLYLAFPFFLDVIQIRNFIVMSIFIFSVKFLYDNRKKAKIKYISLILFATTIHFSAIFYLPMVLINLTKKNKLLNGIALFAVFSSIIFVINDKQIPFLEDMLNLTYASDRIQVYLESRTNWGFLLFWFIQLVSFCMLWYSRLIIKNIVTSDKLQKNRLLKIKNLNSDQIERFVELVYWINIIAFIYLPFYIIDSTFTRLMRNILILNYISFTLVNRIIIGRDQKVIYNFFVILYVLFLFLIQLYLPYTENIVDTIIRNNYILR